MNFNWIKPMFQTVKGLYESKDLLKSIKLTTWIKIAKWAGVGSLLVAGGYLLRQPQVNKLTEETKRSQTEVESLHILIRSYHEQFVRIQSENEAMKAMAYKKEINPDDVGEKSYIMYQYAVKEYIEISLRSHNDRINSTLSKEEDSFHDIFRKVINGEQLMETDAVTLQNYIYPKYQEEIEGLVEPDCNALLQRLVTIA